MHANPIGFSSFIFYSGSGSGSSIRGKTKVSHQARERLKWLIHMGTMSAVQVKGDLQDYYQRKIGEGKHTIGPPMRLVLNAVRNKLIH